MKSKLIISMAFCALSQIPFAQTVVVVGEGSYASVPPAYKSKTDSHDGYNAGLMLTREIFCDESPDTPIPTNDWWTDLINNRYSGALWSYPSMLRTDVDGVEICYPSYWADEGKEVKSRTSLKVSALSFNPVAAIASDWHDLDVTFRMPDANESEKEMRVTMAHGIPFTWFEYEGLTPRISTAGDMEFFGKNNRKGYCGIRIGSDLYGLYYPRNKEILKGKDEYILPECDWMVIALLRDENDLDNYADFAPGVVRDSRINWNYDPTSSTVVSEWDIITENLRDPGEKTPVLLGLLPHVYKYSATMPRQLGTSSYLTPRGEMRIYTDESGKFAWSYTFSGMMPYYASPEENKDSDTGYRKEIMETLMQNYAEKGSFGSDTYWGGKGLLQMAMNMTFAKMSGNTEIYERSKEKLKDVLIDWLTYTPGEDAFFFSYYPRWGGMLGFNVSYDSDAFNDHHFHYGYLIYASALLCLEDSEFSENYGELLRMIAKDYANYDRDDKRFPFLRTFDPWSGHSWAGGLGDAGNDNGNGQESTSESMQSWGGLYLLGVALGDDEMRDAGIWGWSTEARATREYWFDVDSPRPANEGGRKAWAGKGDRIGNYDYEQYKYAYNSNITGKGIGWWTWFGGDPLFMHGIQWMPATPALDYLSGDNDFVDWAYDDMMCGANSTFSHDWFEPTVNSVNGERIDPLADNDWGNVVLSYIQRSRPEEAASVFNRAYRDGRHIATAISTGHISYYLIHHHLTYGEIDFTVTSDCPTSSAYLKNGEYTYMVYNPDDEEKIVKFYKAGKLQKVVLAPSNRLTAFNKDPYAFDIEVTSNEGLILPPGEKTDLGIRILDQYGTTFPTNEPIIFSCPVDGVDITGDGKLSVSNSIDKGTDVSVNISCGDLNKDIRISINDRPEITSYRIEGIPEFVEKGMKLNVRLSLKDQYGNETYPYVDTWHLRGPNGDEVEVSSRFVAPMPGIYTLTAQIKNSSGADYSQAGGVGGQYSEQLLILPVLQNVALTAHAYSSSEENVGSITKNVNDNDNGTRWGSRHTEDEWILLDFGKEYYLTEVIVNWEAAYGCDYDFEIASSGARMTNYTGNYAGVTKIVNVPAEDEWMCVAEVRGNGEPGKKSTFLNTRGRYLRLKGIKRGSAYGYSIYELAVRGLDPNGDKNDFIGIDFGLPETCDQGEEIILLPKAYNLSGEGKDIDVEWITDKNSDISGNTIIPHDYGMMEVCATTSTGLRSSGIIFVNERIRLASIQFSPENVRGITDEEIPLLLTGKNQFGGDLNLTDYPVVIKIVDPVSGEEVNAEVAYYDWRSGIFKASKAGNYRISVNCGEVETTVTILNLSDANLAYGKPANCSTFVGGNQARCVNDENMSTRWESQHLDNQWIEIDLESAYLLNRAVLEWEGAYSEIYGVAISFDGERWWNIHREENGSGGHEEILINDIPARMVRLNCEKRATAWGNSLYEMQLYAKSRFSMEDDGEAPVLERFEVTPGNGDVEVLLTGDDRSGFIMYNVELYRNGNIVNSKNFISHNGDEKRIIFDNLSPDQAYVVKVEAIDAYSNLTTDSLTFRSQLDIIGKNIALHKPVEVTSHESAGLAGEYAVDGDYTTRWGSQFEDNQQLVVDLKDIYSLVEVAIYWDSIAYCADYTVEYSIDGETYEPLIERICWKGDITADNCRTDRISIPVKTYARYIRLIGNKRATQYGASVRELEAYADNDFLYTAVIGIDEGSDYRYEAEDKGIYNIQGIKIRESSEEMMVRSLPSGIYIIRGEKIVVSR